MDLRRVGATVIVLTNCECAGEDGTEFDAVGFGTRLMKSALDG